MSSRKEPPPPTTGMKPPPTPPKPIEPRITLKKAWAHDQLAFNTGRWSYIESQLKRRGVSIGPAPELRIALFWEDMTTLTLLLPEISSLCIVNVEDQPMFGGYWQDYPVLIAQAFRLECVDLRGIHTSLLLGPEAPALLPNSNLRRAFPRPAGLEFYCSSNGAHLINLRAPSVAKSLAKGRHILRNLESVREDYSSVQETIPFPGVLAYSGLLDAAATWDDDIILDVRGKVQSWIKTGSPGPQAIIAGADVDVMTTAAASLVTHPLPGMSVAAFHHFDPHDPATLDINVFYASVTTQLFNWLSRRTSSTSPSQLLSAATPPVELLSVKLRGVAPSALDSNEVGLVVMSGVHSALISNDVVKHIQFRLGLDSAPWLRLVLFTEHSTTDSLMSSSPMHVIPMASVTPPMPPLLQGSSKAVPDPPIRPRENSTRRRRALSDLGARSRSNNWLLALLSAAKPGVPPSIIKLAFQRVHPGESPFTWMEYLSSSLVPDPRGGLWRTRDSIPVPAELVDAAHAALYKACLRLPSLRYSKYYKLQHFVSSTAPLAVPLHMLNLSLWKEMIATGTRAQVVKFVKDWKAATGKSLNVNMTWTPIPSGRATDALSVASKRGDVLMVEALLALGCDNFERGSTAAAGAGQVLCWWMIASHPKAKLTAVTATPAFHAAVDGSHLLTAQKIWEQFFVKASGLAGSPANGADAPEPPKPGTFDRGLPPRATKTSQGKPSSEVSMLQAALSHSARLGDEAMFSWLNGLKPGLLDVKGWTGTISRHPLAQAALGSTLGHVSILGKVMEVVPEEEWGRLFTPVLGDIVANGSVETISLVLRVAKALPLGHKRGALRMAVRRGHLEVVELFVKDGITVCLPGQPVLHLAAELGRVHVVRWLLKFWSRDGDEALKLKVNEVHGDETAAGAAARRGYVEIVGLLVDEKGGDLVVPGDVTNPLVRAARFRFPAVVSWILRSADGPRLLQSGTADGLTVLHAAVLSGSVHLVTLILQADGGPLLLSKQDNNKRTPVQLALEQGQHDVLEAVVLHGSPGHDDLALIAEEAAFVGKVSILRAIDSVHPDFAWHALRGPNQETLLMKACQASEAVVDVVQLLVRKLVEGGHGVDAVGVDGKTALHLVAGSTNAEIVSIILEQGHSKAMDLLDVNGMSPLWHAVAYPRTLAAMLACGVERRHVEFKLHGKTPITWHCASSGYVESFSLLVSAGASGSGFRAQADGSYSFPLCSCFHVAVKSMWFTFARTIAEVTDGADLNVPDSQGRYPAHDIACSRLREDFLVWALNSEMKFDVLTPQGETPLILSVKQWEAVVTRKILEKVPYTLEMTDVHGRTALHHACQSTGHRMVSPLLDAGASMTVRDEDGRTPIHFAAACGRNDALMRMMAKIDHNTSVFQLGDVFGRTPFFLATTMSTPAVMRFLVSTYGTECGADIPDQFGVTPLMIALKNKRADLARMMLEPVLLVDLDAVDNLGQTAEMIAERMECGVASLRRARSIQALEEELQVQSADSMEERTEYDRMLDQLEDLRNNWSDDDSSDDDLGWNLFD